MFKFNGVLLQSLFLEFLKLSDIVHEYNLYLKSTDQNGLCFLLYNF